MQGLAVSVSFAGTVEQLGLLLILRVPLATTTIIVRSRETFTSPVILLVGGLLSFGS